MRIPVYEEEAAALGPDRLPLVLVPAQTPLVAQALEVLGYRYRREAAGGYDLIFDIRPGQEHLLPVPSSSLKGHANYKPEHERLAVDGDPGSRWGSAHPQAGDMRFAVEVDPPARVRALRYRLGEWRHDYPRGLEIELGLVSGERRLLLSREQYQAILYYGRAGAELVFFFDPVTLRRLELRQLGAHPVLDWSIAEIELYR